MVRLRDSWHLRLSAEPTSGNPTRLLQPDTVSLRPTAAKRAGAEARGFRSCAQLSWKRAISTVLAHADALRSGCCGQIASTTKSASGTFQLSDTQPYHWWPWVAWRTQPPTLRQ